MSGAEVLFVIGLLPSIISLLQTSGRVVSQIIGIGKEVKAAPKALRNLQAVLRAAELVLQKTEGWARAGNLDDETCGILRPIITECGERVTELKDILGKLTPSEKGSRFANAWKTVSAITQEKKINDIRDQILRNLQMITNAALITRLTEDEMSSINTTSVALLIDKQLQDSMQQLKSPTYYQNQVQSCKDSFNNSSNQFTSYNAPVVYQFFNNLPSFQTIGGLGAPQTSIHRITSPDRSGSLLSSSAGSFPAINSTSGERIAEIQFEAPRSTVNSSRGQQYGTYSNNGESFSPTLIDDGSSHTILASKDPSEEMETAKTILQFASSNVNKNQSVAKQSFLVAIRRYRDINTDDPILLLRKYRNLTAAALGLTLVVNEKEKQIERARDYNRKAYMIACNLPQLSSKAGVKIDEANINARAAKILQTRKEPQSKIISTLTNAFDSFHWVTQELHSKCNSIEDWDVLAQALHGCGLMSRKLSNVGLMNRSNWTGYFQEGLKCVDNGTRLPDCTAAALDSLTETGKNIKRDMAST
ncbi:hypothetical protein MMC11_000075 [Xylographa trunciseda]|nr:hypothetical protein [Xylographa trunciseda]